ncbi:MAG: S8 family serine peptidase [Blastocatellia bacterium]
MIKDSKIPGRLLLIVSLVIVVLAGGILPVASSAITYQPQNDPRVMRKVAPWVLERTADGQRAEFLVVLGEQADLSRAEYLPTREEKGRYVFETLLAHSQRTQRSMIAWLQERGIEYQSFYIVNTLLVKGDRDTAVSLAARPDVGRIEGNPVITGISPVDPGVGDEPRDEFLTASPQAIERGITYIRAPEVWAAGYTGQGIVIGGQDTGVKWDHPALMSRYRGWNGTAASHDYNWHDSIHSGGGDCGSDSKIPCDDDTHGTHTLGTALGTDGGDNQIGVAPGAKFIACRNMDRGNGTPATYLECFQFFLAPYPVNATPDRGDPTKAPDLTVNSWGCPPSEGCAPETLRAAVEAERAAGIMTIVAAGNTGPSCSTIVDPPATYDASYTIAAIASSTGLLASFSSRGPVSIDGSGRMKPDIAAPGVTIRSALRSGGYGNLSGTSMATPHVAGAVALLWSAFPHLRGRVDATEKILNDSATRVASSACGSTGIPNSSFGFGRLDIKAAYDLVAGRYYAASGQVSDVGSIHNRTTIRFTRVSGTGVIPGSVETDAAGRWSQSGFESGTVYRAIPARSRTRFEPGYRDITGLDTQVSFTVTTRGFVIIN